MLYSLLTVQLYCGKYVGQVCMRINHFNACSLSAALVDISSCNSAVCLAINWKLK